MTSRRSFVRNSSLAVLAAQWTSCLSALPLQALDPAGIDWDAIKELFPISKWNKLQFNSGSAGVMPTPIQEHLIKLSRKMNDMAPYEALTEWSESLTNTKQRLAALTHSETDEIQLVRNTTEALNMIIYGLPLEAGDEVILTEHDYPYAVNAWRNRSSRDGIVCRQINVDIPNDDASIVEAYASQITPRTKVMHVTYITHRQGHMLPVKDLIALAQKHNLQVVVDGAHTIGQIPINLQDLDCDYFATSLHKWLNAPHGTGLLYVRKDRIKELMLHPSSADNDDTINKYAHLGTRAWQQEVGISAALDFHESLGAQNKYKRLQELKHYWTKSLRKNPKITWHTDLSDDKSCSVVTIGIDGYSGGQIVKELDEKYNIHAKSVGGRWGSGVRISPNIFTSFADLDQLVLAISSIAKS